MPTTTRQTDTVDDTARRDAYFRVDGFHVDAKEMVGDRLRIDGYLSRTGVQIYDQGDGTVRREQRDASEVFAPEAMSSLRAMPVVVGHPKNQMVDGSNWSLLSKGHVGDVVEKAADGKHTKASVWILDGDTQKKILGGQLTELSVGYYAGWDPTPGINDAGERFDGRQINIRGNHLGLVGPGSGFAPIGGPTCRLCLDARGDVVFDSSPPVRPAAAPSGAQPGRQARRDAMKFKLMIGGAEQEVELPDEALTAIAGAMAPLVVEQIQAAMKVEEEAPADAEPDSEPAPEDKPVADALRAKLDAEKARADALQARLDAELSPEQLTLRADARARLVAAADRIAGRKLDSAKLGDLALKRAALEAAGVKIDGRSDAYLEARFDAAVEVAGAGERSAASARAASREPQTQHRSSAPAAGSIDGAMRLIGG